LGLDRVGEFAQGFDAHVDARLILAPLQQVQRQTRQAVAHLRRRFNRGRTGSLGEQGTQFGEATTQRRLFAGHVRSQ
jgi:hypothetical protein